MVQLIAAFYLKTRALLLLVGSANVGSLRLTFGAADVEIFELVFLITTLRITVGGGVAGGRGIVHLLAVAFVGFHFFFLRELLIGGRGFVGIHRKRGNWNEMQGVRGQRASGLGPVYERTCNPNCGPPESFCPAPTALPLRPVSSSSLFRVVVVGNGVAGSSCALELRRLRPDAHITLVADEAPHHYSRPALMYLYTGQLRLPDIKPHADALWAQQRIALVQARAVALAPTARLLHLADGPALPYDALLLATGSVSRRPTCLGQDLTGVQTFYNLTDVVQMQRLTQGINRGVVAGGGLVGIELAEMLHSRRIATTLLIRDGHYWASVLPPAEAELVAQQLVENKIDAHYHSEIAEILGDASGRVRAVRTTTGTELPCQWVGLAVGVRPNLSLTAPGLATDQGYLVDNQLQTSLPGIFAAGDCAQLHTPGAGQMAIEQLWYTGRAQGQTVAHSLAGQATDYQRGPWFNSAKFFHLEYQTYGHAPAATTAAGLKSAFWQHASGRHGIRLYFEAETPHKLLGINALGLRLRHDTCDAWLRAAAPLAQVLAEWPRAAFDPEFARQHHAALRTTFAQWLV